jgi:hypothetical protein
MMVTQRTEGPMGIPGQRDPLSPCLEYQPTPYMGYWDTCEGDGHYLCQECCHLYKELPEGQPKQAGAVNSSV